MSKYNDIMKKIELTDEMRERVLEKTASAMESSPAVSSEEKHDELSQPSEMQIKNKDRDKAVKAYSNGGMIFSIVTLAAAVMFFVFGFVMTIKKSYSNDSTSISNVDYNPTIDIPIAGGQITGGVPIDMLLNTGEREDVEQSFENIEELNNALGMNLKEPIGFPFTVDERNYYLLKNGAVLIEYVHGNSTFMTESGRIFSWIVASEKETALDGVWGEIASGFVLSDMTPVALIGADDGGQNGFYYDTAFWYDGQFYNVLSSFDCLRDTELEEFKALVEEINALNSHD